MWRMVGVLAFPLVMIMQIHPFFNFTVRCELKRSDEGIITREAVFNQRHFTLFSTAL